MKKLSYEAWAFINFTVLALFGVLLRYMMSFPSGGLSYLNILHAHSHFAFAGWSFLGLAVLIVRHLYQDEPAVFKWIFLATLVCAFGMLLSFSVQGYKAVSILFSTLFLVVSCWFAALIYRRSSSDIKKTIAGKLLKAGAVCIFISSLGPLALAVLKASGHSGVFYQNAIYFYLHFQLNGWMQLAVLALLAIRYLKDDAADKRTTLWTNLFILSSFPLFFIFPLWVKPPSWVIYTASLAAILNAWSWFMILGRVWHKTRQIPALVEMALLAISVKVIFQILICYPPIGEWTFLNRNLIIGYVHLITLGCVTPMLISQFDESRKREGAKTLDRLYELSTISYLVLLFTQPLLTLLGVTIPHFQIYLLAISVLFSLLGFAYSFRFFQPALKKVGT